MYGVVGIRRDDDSRVEVDELGDFGTLGVKKLRELLNINRYLLDVRCVYHKVHIRRVSTNGTRAADVSVEAVLVSLDPRSAGRGKNACSRAVGVEICRVGSNRLCWALSNRVDLRLGLGS